MKRKYQVGGILYSLFKPQDIKQDRIDLSSVNSSVHQPVIIEDVSVDKYVPRFNFTRNHDVTETNSQETPRISQITLESKPEITSITLNEQTPLLNGFSSAYDPSEIKLSMSSSNESIWNEIWNKYGQNLGIKDNKAYLYLLGQIKHESDNFKHMTELSDGSVYEGRQDLGNVNKGDGKKYKGRGPIQVTGRYNYEKIYNDFFVPNGLGQYNIVDNPNLADDPRIGALLSLGWLAVTENGKKAIAESNNYNIQGLTKAINGGYNGLDDRIKRTNELIKQYS